MDKPHGMDVFIARQPIFDRHARVRFYELLFRDGVENVFGRVDPYEATAAVMTDSFFLFCSENLTFGKKALINATREVLVDESIALLPAANYGIEITEDILPDAAVINACCHLKERDYLLVLDDFRFSEAVAPLLELADIVKVDVLATPLDEQIDLIRRLQGSSVALLAEKVETVTAFEQAKKLGYAYFQGFFFSRPEVVSNRDVPAMKMHYLQILQEINQPELDLDQIAETIKRDVSLSFKLLRYVNSPFFGLRAPIRSLHHALVVLGEKEVRKWACLLALGRMGEDKPIEYLVHTLIRARFCEGLAASCGLAAEAHDLFLMGLFSMLHVFIGRPLEELLLAIPIAEEVKAALLGVDNRMQRTLQLVIAYERGDWRAFALLAGHLGLSQEAIPATYVAAVQWAEQSCAAVQAAD